MTNRPDTDALARTHFSMFDRLGNEITVDDDDRRRLLLLSANEWSAWSRMRDGGPVPKEPKLPVMLRRLSAATYRLARVAERGQAA
ncbi:MAG: hypothetical protein ACREF3_16650 [Acetobacteraceae bacterium]